MSSIPSPVNSIRYGMNGSPNACNLCHDEQTPEWAATFIDEWYGEKSVQVLTQ